MSVFILQLLERSWPRFWCNRSFPNQSGSIIMTSYIIIRVKPISTSCTMSNFHVKWISWISNSGAMKESYWKTQCSFEHSGFSVWSTFHMEVYWLKEIQSTWNTFDYCLVSYRATWAFASGNPLIFSTRCVISHICSDTSCNKCALILWKSLPFYPLSIQKNEEISL